MPFLIRFILICSASSSYSVLSSAKHLTKSSRQVLQTLCHEATHWKVPALALILIVFLAEVEWGVRWEVARKSHRMSNDPFGVACFACLSVQKAVPKGLISSWLEILALVVDPPWNNSDHNCKKDKTWENF